MKKAMTGLIFGIAIMLLFIIKIIPDQVEASNGMEQSSKFVKNIDLDKAKNLMISAHPDDETIWGGDHLLEEDYLVVCVTCGTNNIRDKEIKRALNISDDQLIKLGYPDNPDNVVNDWSDYQDDIAKDLEQIILMKDYDKIVTHNKEGEYGHIHHRMTSKMVTDITKEHHLTEKLYYFAKYYSRKDVDANIAVKFPLKNYSKKINEMVKVYKSQAFIETDFNHAMISENWQKYSDLQKKTGNNVNF